MVFSKNEGGDRTWQTESKALRCVHLSLSMLNLDLMSIGLVNDMFTEREDDDAEYDYRACKSDFDAF